MPEHDPETRITDRELIEKLMSRGYGPMWLGTSYVQLQDILNRFSAALDRLEQLEATVKG